MMERFDSWLQAFGAAWQNRDAVAMAALFNQDGAFFETPFGPPHRGRDDIQRHWRDAFAKQADVVFMYRALAMQDDLGVARWAAQFTLTETGVRLEFDGVLECRLGADGESRLLRMWWHDRKAPRRNPAA
ncbi:YybH family protein [Minwuia sp.]|uniref:YybH family protein n=1 Tax=Minwuia sp. TaxID=2493630 RepID=UPI003A907BF7